MQVAGQFVDRHVAPLVDVALGDTRVVVIQGARQVGKSTLASAIAGDRPSRFVTLDDEAARRAAVDDPDEFVVTDELLVIDEVQRAPGLLLAIKAAVDRDNRPGRYLLTGSADLLRLRSVEDSLAGRVETIELFGFSQGEIDGTVEHFVDAVFGGGLPPRWQSAVTRVDYLARACAGGYPEALGREGRRRGDWLANYATRLLQRDAREVSHIQRLGDLPRLLRLIAARNASELNKADLASDAGFPATTIDPYLDLLETLYLVWRMPAWSSNLTKRVVGRPKITVVDSGLAASLLNLSPEGMHPTRNPTAAGPLLEAFVANEVRRQLAWSDARAQLFHFRDRAGPEVDLILEHRDGRVVAIDVKASTSPGRDAFRWLSYLRDRLGDRFVQGIVLYTGPDALSFGDRLVALPIEALWRRW